MNGVVKERTRYLAWIRIWHLIIISFACALEMWNDKKKLCIIIRRVLSFMMNVLLSTRNNDVNINYKLSHWKTQLENSTSAGSEFKHARSHILVTGSMDLRLWMLYAEQCLFIICITPRAARTDFACQEQMKCIQHFASPSAQNCHCHFHKTTFNGCLNVHTLISLLH